MDKWFSRTADEAIQFWRTDPKDGLSTNDVKSRLEKFGCNEVAEKPKPSWIKRFIAQFQDFMVLVLLAATLISALLGELVDAVTILAIVIINAILGFIQEFKAEQSMEALKKLTAPSARVIRNGMTQSIPARELVPGDILVLEAGDRLGADGRLLESQNLEVEESALTGESLPVRKWAEKIFREDSPLGDRKNMVYSGTSITRGRGKAVICATGMATEVGKIAGMIQAVETVDTPLQKRLNNLGRLLVWGCLAICALVVITGLMRGEPLFLMCMAGISLAVAAIPEGLPAIVTVALALGVQRMIDQNSIVRKLPAVETLGCTTVICSDKTGTLTQNQMTVRKIVTIKGIYEVTGTGYDIKGEFLHDKQEFDPKKDKTLQQSLLTAALCNNSELKLNNVSVTGLWRRKSENCWTVEGDPTEGALAVVAAKSGIWQEELHRTLKRVGEIPFESERMRMSVIYRHPDGSDMLYVKGAPDTILELCRYYSDGTEERPMTPEILKFLIETNETMTSEALRVLAVAYRKISRAEAANPDENLEKELVFTGIFGMIDPPREEVKQSISLCKQAGIKTVMITGDHRNTAVAIAKELRMYEDMKSKVLTGKELDALSDAELVRVVNDIAVYARVSPAHKLRIVRALKQCGHVVAMTGDGVNDAPAIKEADIGVAMGLTGTEVTKEASSMVLADDNFATIVSAVEEGRGIYDNIRKFIRYLLACNIGEVLTMFTASLIGMPIPLVPVQILWVNLVTDGLPAMGLGVDPKEPDIMKRPPRNPRESVFSRGLLRKILTRGVQIGLSTIAVFAFVYYFKNDLNLARTMALTTLVFCQIFHVFDCRSEVLTIFELNFLSNKYLIMAVACSITMHLAVIYHPFLNGVFATVPLSLSDWSLILVVAGWTFIMNTIRHAFIWKKVRTGTVFTRAR